MRKLIQGYWSMIAAIIFLSACSSSQKVTTSHYILEYLPHTENVKYFQDEPINATVIVSDTKIPSMYDRKQIVIRHFGPRITYSDDNVWASNLNDIVPQLISTRLNRYHIFKLAQREFLSQRPDYEISTQINNIEALSSENVMQARINMEFTLKKADEEKVIVRHSFDKEKTLVNMSFEDFVQEINEMLLEETDVFIGKILYSFSEGKDKEYLPVNERASDAYYELSSELDDSTSSGLLVLPNLSQTDNEPYFKVLNKELEEVGAARIGEPLKLNTGNYTLLYGSGTEAQMMMRRNVRINPRYKTMIDPDWGVLTVSVIDQNRDYMKVRYELFSSQTGESYGSELPADLEQGEQQKVWVLKPGLYKITINNEPFNAYQDFVTVFLEEGKSEDLKIVVDTDEEGVPTHLIGAGVLDDNEMYSSRGAWKFDSAIHGNLNYSQNNETAENDITSTILLNTQFDNRAYYRKDRLHYTLKSLIEVEATDGNQQDFQISYDEMDLKNTLVYYFLGNFGFYTRLDGESHLFQRYEPFSAPISYAKVNLQGDTIASVTNADKIKTKESLFPFILKEGIGINWRMLNSPKATLSVRSGFGTRQDFNNDYYLYNVTVDGVRIYQEQESTYSEGTEISVVGNFRLPLGLTYTTNADVLIPFAKDAAKTMEWENDFNLRLFRYISLDYKLRLKNKVPDEGSEYIVKEDKLFLRLTYFLR